MIDGLTAPPPLTAAQSRGNFYVTMIDVEEYVCEDGSCPYQTWFDNLGVDVAVTAAKAKTKMTLGAHDNIKTLNEGLRAIGFI